jgi:hypothetical protein
VRAAAWTRIRCSVELGTGTGTGRVVSMRVFEAGSGWRRAFIVAGNVAEGMAGGATLLRLRS